MKKRENPFRRRSGAAAVEFAVVAPVFILLLMGMIEMGRGLMVQQMLINATREGARRAALPDANSDKVKAVVTDYLARTSIRVSPNKIAVSPDPATTFNNEQITVSASVPYASVAWTVGKYLHSDLRAATTMRSERFQ